MRSPMRTGVRGAFEWRNYEKILLSFIQYRPMPCAIRFNDRLRPVLKDQTQNGTRAESDGSDEDDSGYGDEHELRERNALGGPFARTYEDDGQNHLRADN